MRGYTVSIAHLATPIVASSGAANENAHTRQGLSDRPGREIERERNICKPCMNWEMVQSYSGLKKGYANRAARIAS